MKLCKFGFLKQLFNANFLVGAAGLVFLILTIISTMLKPDKFFELGVCFIFGMYISAVILIVFWRREKNVSFIENILKNLIDPKIRQTRYRCKQISPDRRRCSRSLQVTRLQQYISRLSRVAKESFYDRYCFTSGILQNTALDRHVDKCVERKSRSG